MRSWSHSGLIGREPTGLIYRFGGRARRNLAAVARRNFTELLEGNLEAELLVRIGLLLAPGARAAVAPNASPLDAVAAAHAVESATKLLAADDDRLVRGTPGERLAVHYRRAAASEVMFR